MAQTFDLSSSAVAEQGLADHILLAVDQSADQWLGVITHELAHVFGFDILPSKSIATWIREGLAEVPSAGRGIRTIWSCCVMPSDRMRCLR